MMFLAVFLVAKYLGTELGFGKITKPCPKIYAKIRNVQNVKGHLSLAVIFISTQRRRLTLVSCPKAVFQLRLLIRQDIQIHPSPAHSLPSKGECKVQSAD
jgi:VanZ family protein